MSVYGVIRHTTVAFHLQFPRSRASPAMRRHSSAGAETGEKARGATSGDPFIRLSAGDAHHRDREYERHAHRDGFE